MPSSDDPPVLVALCDVLTRLGATLERLTVCEGCGCLCRPTEVCPCCHPDQEG
jgi:hypothetical protein